MEQRAEFPQPRGPPPEELEAVLAERPGENHLVATAQQVPVCRLAPEALRGRLDRTHRVARQTAGRAGLAPVDGGGRPHRLSTQTGEDHAIWPFNWLTRT